MISYEWKQVNGDETKEKIIEAYESHYKESTDTIKYAVINNNIVGWYRYSLWPRDDLNSKRIHLLDIAVLPEYQKKGIAKKLIIDLITTSKEKGLKKSIAELIKIMIFQFNCINQLDLRNLKKTTKRFLYLGIYY